MEQSKNNSDTLLVIVVIWMFLSRVFWAILPKVFTEYYTLPWFTIVRSISSLLWAFIPILIAFAIKDKNKQLVVLVIGALYLLYELFELTRQFMSSFNF